MDTFYFFAIAGLCVWNVLVCLRVYRIETYLAESEQCDDCRKAASPDAESSDDDF